MAIWITATGDPTRASAHPEVPLRTLISRQDRPIDKSKTALADLQLIAKITFGGELVLRKDEEKRGYKGPLFEARPDELIISKIRVGQGSFCIVPAMGPIAVSPEYPVYALDTGKVRPDFIARVLRTPSFTKALTQAKSGNTTKQRIRPEFFESQVVPLPPLDQQREMMAAHDALIAQAAALDAQAEQTEAHALAAFEKALGYGPQPPLPDRPIFIAQFRELDRWSHDAILRRQVGGADGAAFPVEALGEVVADLENGWSPRCLDRPAEGEEWGVLKVSAVSGRVYRAAQNKALPATLKAKPTLTVVAGDVLIARASGDARLVGAAAYVEDTPPRLMISDKVFRVVFREDSPVRAKFVAAVLATNGVRSQIMSEFSNDSGMAKNIAKPALLALRFPLPPLDVQDTMIDALDAARAEAARLRAEAEALRVRAAHDFEEAVYGAAEAETPEEPAAA